MRIALRPPSSLLCATCTLQEDTTYHIARMLHVNRSLLALHLAKNAIADTGAKLLAEYLGDNPCLRLLDLRG